MKNKIKAPKKRMKIAEIFEMPKDAVLGESLITLTGKREALIENFKGILEYTEGLIRVMTKEGIIELKGRGFLITYLTDEEMKITGYFEEINY